MLARNHFQYNSDLNSREFKNNTSYRVREGEKKLDVEVRGIESNEEELKKTSEKLYMMRYVYFIIILNFLAIRTVTIYLT